MDPLVSPADPDWLAFKDGDESYLLGAAGELIRRFCGWHIWPSLTETVPKLRVGSANLIMLPSLHVTDVSSVAVGSEVVDPNNYAWFESGYVQLGVNAAWLGRAFDHVGDGPGGGYAPDPGVARLAGVPNGLGRLAEVTMTHGFIDVPVVVKQVAFELAAAAAEMPAGNVRDIQTPGFRLSLSQDAGLALNTSQMDRLAGFKLSWTR